MRNNSTAISQMRSVRPTSQKEFDPTWNRRLGGDTHIYEGRRFLYPFQPEQGSVCALRCFLRYLFDLLKTQVPSVEELAAEEQVRKHCKGQRLPSFPRIKLKNHLPLVVGDGQIEMRLPQRCCEAFVEYLHRAGTEVDLKRGISII